MQYDFLKAFPKRMKNVGLYALLFTNSSGKAIWKQFGFEELYEQLNLDFAVLLFIMEQSLKEKVCTTDDISAFIDTANSQYFRKPMTFADCRELGDFVINNVLSNEGRPMYFHGYDFEGMVWQQIHVSYVANKIVYLDQDVRRTSYYLTDDGYNLLLGTLEVENNMRLSVQELIFQLHLEKQSYDKALDAVKNLFNSMRIQIQKIAEAMNRIRRNVLDFNVEDYRRLLEEDLSTLNEAREKFKGHRAIVKARVQELEHTKIDVRALDVDAEKNLKYLKEIDGYLGRAIDEYQRILNGHFDLNKLYTDELEKIAEMALVQRFHFRTELFDPILQDPSALGRLDAFLYPLFNREPDRILNLNRILEAQRVSSLIEEDEASELIDFDEEAWQKEQEALRKAKQAKYEMCLSSIMETILERKTVSLSEITEAFQKEGRLQELLPDISTFKEIMVEFLRIKRIDIAALRAERKDHIIEDTWNFCLNAILLKILDTHPKGRRVAYLTLERIPNAVPVKLEYLEDTSGVWKAVRCSDVTFHIEEE